MKISSAGIYDLPAEIYHGDPCPSPSVSRSFLNEMIMKSPRHAWAKHPRLNQSFERIDRKSFDLGNAAHDVMLLGGERISVLDFPDFRTSAAKAARDAAVAEKKIPILAEKYQSVLAMEKEFRESCDGLTNGLPERSIVWQEPNGVWCRIMIDWITNDGGEIEDYKTTGVESPERWIEGTFFEKGYDLQAYMALRGYHAVTGRNAEGFRFYVQETHEPHMVYSVVPDQATLEQAEAKFLRGVHLHEECLESGVWRGYSSVYTAFPSYRANRIQEKMERENR